MPDFVLERLRLAEGREIIAGVDEVGRGALCGPVVAAAVAFPAALIRKARRPAWLRRANDSKRLAPAVREVLARIILAEASSFGVGFATNLEVDERNVHRAGLEAMRRAIARMPVPPEFVLVDGFLIPGLDRPQEGVPHGDARSLSIAAASILAKVLRDHVLVACAALYPGYGLEDHKGYATRAHYAALADLGPTPFHRRSFQLELRPGAHAGRASARRG